MITAFRSIFLRAQSFGLVFREDAFAFCRGVSSMDSGSLLPGVFVRDRTIARRFGNPPGSAFLVLRASRARGSVVVCHLTVVPRDPKRLGVCCVDTVLDRVGDLDVDCRRPVNPPRRLRI